MTYGRNGRVISDSQVDHPLDKKLRERIEKIRMTAPVDKYSTKVEEKNLEEKQKKLIKIYILILEYCLSWFWWRF